MQSLRMNRTEFPLINIHSHLPSPSSGIGVHNVIFGKDNIPHQTWFSLGIHPWYLPESVDLAMEKLREECQNPFCLAMGEAGLDRLCGSPWPAQQQAFRIQVRLATELGKPLIIHSVRAGEDVINTLQEESFTGTALVHGFNQKASHGKRYLEAGLLLSFGSALLRSSSPAAAMLKELKPDQAFFLETDDSTVSIEAVYQAASVHLQVSMETLKATLFTHFTTLFPWHESY